MFGPVPVTGEIRKRQSAYSQGAHILAKIPIYKHIPAMKCYKSYAEHVYRVQWAFTREGIRFHFASSD